MVNVKNGPGYYALDLFFFRENIKEAKDIKKLIKEKSKILSDLPIKDYKISWGGSGELSGDKMSLDIVSVVGVFKTKSNWEKAIKLMDKDKRFETSPSKYHDRKSYRFIYE